MLKFIILVFFCITIAISKNIEIEEKWREFKTNFNKVYNSAKEEQYRKKIWMKNFKYVESFELLNPNATFKVQINEFSDRRTEVCRMN